MPHNQAHARAQVGKGVLALPAVLLHSLSKDVGVSIGSLDGKQDSVDEHISHAHVVALPLKPFVLLMDIGEAVLVTEEDSEKEGRLTSLMSYGTAGRFVVAVGAHGSYTY